MKNQIIYDITTGIVVCQQGTYGVFDHTIED